MLRQFLKSYRARIKHFRRAEFKTPNPCGIAFSKVWVMTHWRDAILCMVGCGWVLLLT